MLFLERIAAFADIVERGAEERWESRKKQKQVMNVAISDQTEIEEYCHVCTLEDNTHS